MEIALRETVTIKELLARYPYLLGTFIDMGLMCVGCPADAFHNLADVAKAYGLDKKQFMARLKGAIDAGAPLAPPHDPHSYAGKQGQ